ncbi:MAG: adenylate/guanylate cyclase domain-containing protein [Candidatus Latescibacterota bacterium]|jgi:adenylate cyclase
MSHLLRRLAVALVIAVLVTAGLLVVSRVGVFADLLRSFEARTLDYRMAHYRGPTVPPGTVLDDVVIVDVDERSLAELGQFFRWPRYYHAAVVDTLARAGARVIGFDLLFSEPDRMEPAVADHYARSLADSVDGLADRRDFLLSLSGDPALVAAAQRAGRVVFGAQARFAEEDSGAVTWVPPVPALAAVALGLGHVQIVPDPDGIVRRIPAVVEAGGQVWPALGLRLALEALGRPSSPVRLDPASGVKGEGWTLPTDADGDLLLDYAGPPGTFLRVSYADVLRGRTSSLLFRDRIVLIGATASGLMDYFSVPFSPHFPGVEIHANLVHDLLQQRFIRPAGPIGEIAGLFLIGLAAGLLVLFLRPGLAVAGCTVVLAAYVLFAFERFAGSGVWIGVILPLAAWMAAAASASGYRYWAEERSKQAIKRAFSRYLAPQVVEQIAGHPERLGLGGDERVLTVGFVDIRDFTTLSEGMTAGRLTAFLNDYLSEMTATVLAEEGTVDKYIGDAIMMLFGAPNALPDHAARACRTALAMRRVVSVHQAHWQARHRLDGVRIGVGLNTGTAAVGNMGSAFRFDYTAMGDCVNLASRLEGLTKVYGTDLIVGPETAALIGPEFALRELDLVRVKGKREAVRIFEVHGLSAETVGFHPLDAAFAEGLRCFRARDWEGARRCFDACRQLRPEDGPTLYYLRLIEALAATPPPADWDGVSVMEHK